LFHQRRRTAEAGRLKTKVTILRRAETLARLQTVDYAKGITEEKKLRAKVG
jgi:hypothetical protein